MSSLHNGPLFLDTGVQVQWTAVEPFSNDAESTGPRFYEPFEVHICDRVRLVSRAECPVSNTGESHDGKHATVVFIDRDSPDVAVANGHYYAVRVDGYPYTVWCAAVELEPLEPA